MDFGQYTISLVQNIVVYRTEEFVEEEGFNPHTQPNIIPMKTRIWGAFED